MLSKIAKIISTIFHPFIFCWFTLSILISTDSHLATLDKIFFWAIAIIFSSLATIIFVYDLKSKGIIESVDIDSKDERIKPFLVGGISNLIGFLLLRFFDAPHIIQGLLFSCTAISFLLLILTRWWKISVHATGISVFIVILNYHFGRMILPLYSIIVLVCLSRLLLKKHTIEQVMIGAMLGLTVTALQLQLFR
jgi:membrane-associated phospholipid phosphatase